LLSFAGLLVTDRHTTSLAPKARLIGTDQSATHPSPDYYRRLVTMTDSHPHHHPLLSAEEIEAALVERKHPINPLASRTQACMSDMGE
jgi:hypothetical protein